MRRRAGWWLWIAGLFLSAAHAHAEPTMLTCRFPERAKSLIMPQIVLRHDPATGRTTVEDRLILEIHGRPKAASVEYVYKNRAVIRAVHSWRLDGLSYATVPGGYMDFQLKVEANGRAFVATLPPRAPFTPSASAKGQCS